MPEKTGAVCCEARFGRRRVAHQPECLRIEWMQFGDTQISVQMPALLLRKSASVEAPIPSCFLLAEPRILDGRELLISQAVRCIQPYEPESRYESPRCFSHQQEDDKTGRRLAIAERMYRSMVDGHSWRCMRAVAVAASCAPRRAKEGLP